MRELESKECNSNNKLIFTIVIPLVVPPLKRGYQKLLITLRPCIQHWGYRTPIQAQEDFYNKSEKTLLNAA